MKRSVAKVSDHAVIRYLERVMHLDVEALRAEIGRKVDKLDAVERGACGVIVDGLSFKIRDGVVTTVLSAHRPDMRTGRQRRERAE